MCRLFPCIPIFRGFFPIKKCKKKMRLCDKFKKGYVTYEKCIY